MIKNPDEITRLGQTFECPQAMFIFAANTRK